MKKSMFVFFLATAAISAAGCSGGEETVADANGCTDFKDATSIAFGGDLANTYSPACARVSAGATVTWSGDFSAHFLVGGSADSEGEHPDSASPIKRTTTGTSVKVTFSDPGTYPYFCEQHGTMGMVGAVLVE